MNGWITIGTKLDTDEFDRQISQLEKKMQKEEDKKILIEAKLDTQEADLEKARAKTDELANAYQRLKTLKEKTNKTPSEFSEMQGIQQQYGSSEKLDTSFNKALDKQIALEQKVEGTKAQYESVNKEVDEYKQKIENVKTQKQVEDAEKLKDSFKGVGSSIQDAVKHVARLALGIFGIRSAYMALRRASSDLASYDQQYATNLEYIRYALTQMIAPVLRAIVQLAMQALQFINMIVNALFGVNLFSQASAENFNKMKTSASGVSKAVKEIKKQLLGFDEINMLTDQSDTGTSPGAAGVGTPDIDLSKIEGEPPEWLKWILDNKDLILAILGGIAAGLVAIKLGLSGIQALGIGLLVGGIIYGIQNLIKYLDDPSWQNFGKIIEGIGIAITGLGIIIAAATGSWIVAFVGGIVTIVGAIISNWEIIKTNIQGAIDWLFGQMDWVRENFGIVGEFIYNLFVNTLQAVLDIFDALFQGAKGIFDGFIEFFKGVFTGNWQQAWEGIKNIFTSIWDTITKILGAFGNWIYNVVIQPVFNFFSGLWTGIVNGFSAAWEGIKSIFSRVTEFFRTIFTNAWTAVKNVFMTGGKIFDGIKEGIVNAFKAIVNAIILGINKVVAIPFNAINGVLSAIKNVNIFGITPFNWIQTIGVPQIPYLKTGGIVNMPNRGTMIGGAMAGESGREGVVPLTDQQAMAELGREIGKNVLVNLTNITSMNGRVISRELKTIQSEQNFAYNI